MSESLKDLEAILDIEPENSAALKEYDALKPPEPVRLVPAKEIQKFKKQRIYRKLTITDVGKPKSNKKTSSNQINIKRKMNPTKIPNNWFQMEKDLRDLSITGEHKDLNAAAVDYLSAIPPSSFKTLIGENLDTTCLSRMIHAFAENKSLGSVDISERLLSLQKLSRFDVAWMLAEDAIRDRLQNLLLRITDEKAASSIKSFYM